MNGMPLSLKGVAISIAIVLLMVVARKSLFVAIDRDWSFSQALMWVVFVLAAFVNTVAWVFGWW